MKWTQLCITLVTFLTATLASPFEGQFKCESLPAMIQVYLQNHYAVHQLDDQLKERTVEQFVDSLDPSRTTLLESDAEKIRAMIPPMVTLKGVPQCEDILQVQEIMVRRSAEAMEFASSVLQKTFEVDPSVVINTDPDQRQFAKTREERQSIISDMIHFQYANFIATEMEPKKARERLYHRFELALKRAKETTRLDMLNQFMGSFALALDPHSSFMSAERLEDFRISMELKLEGIGAQLTWKNGYTIIDEIVAGGAADRQGELRPKDKILAVAQQGEDFKQIIDMDLTDVVRLIRGPKGTTVRLSILRQGSDTERFEVAIERDVIDIKDSAARLDFVTSPAGRKMAVIELPSFYGDPAGGRSSSKDVAARIKEAKEAGAEGLILNLSRNGGGLLDEAVKVAGLFLKTGAVVATQNTLGQTRVLKDEDPKVQWDGPLVVWISRRSASASEIVAGAIRDYRRGILVGDSHTFGKGTVQMFTPISDEFGGVTITTGMFFRPSGVSTQKDGVPADIILPGVWNRDDFGEKALDYVLPGQTIPQFRNYEANSPRHKAARWLSSGVLRQVREKSEARVSETTSFQEITQEIQEAEENRYVLKVSDLLEAGDKEEGEDSDSEEDEKSRLEIIAEADAPYLKELSAILDDFISEIRSE